MSLLPSVKAITKELRILQFANHMAVDIDGHLCFADNKVARSSLQLVNQRIETLRQEILKLSRTEDQVACMARLKRAAHKLEIRCQTGHRLNWVFISIHRLLASFFGIDSRWTPPCYRIDQSMQGLGKSGNYSAELYEQALALLEESLTGRNPAWPAFFALSKTLDEKTRAATAALIAQENEDWCQYLLVGAYLNPKQSFGVFLVPIMAEKPAVFVKQINNFHETLEKVLVKVPKNDVEDFHARWLEEVKCLSVLKQQELLEYFMASASDHMIARVAEASQIPDETRLVFMTNRLSPYWFPQAAALASTITDPVIQEEARKQLSKEAINGLKVYEQELRNYTFSNSNRALNPIPSAMVDFLALHIDTPEVITALEFAEDATCWAIVFASFLLNKKQGTGNYTLCQQLWKKDPEKCVEAFCKLASKTGFKACLGPLLDCISGQQLTAASAILSADACRELCALRLQVTNTSPAQVNEKEGEKALIASLLPDAKRLVMQRLMDDSEWYKYLQGSLG